MCTLANIFVQILRVLREHKLRTFLTMFGIAWGVGSLLLLVGLGEGFRSGNKREMAEFGKDIMFVFPGRAPVIEGSVRSARNYLLTYQDYLDVRDTAQYVRDAVPVLVRGELRAVSEFANTNGEIAGVEPQFNQIRFLPLKQGRWLNDADESQKRNVIVLGDEMTRTLFPGRPAIGATILLDGISFKVVGTVQRVGHGDNNSTNMRGYISYRVMSMYFPLKGDGQRGAISFINYQPRTRRGHLFAQHEVRKIIARNHGFDERDDNAFELWDTIQQSEMIGALFDAMDMFLGSVGLATLAIGAIGVVNIMLVSVSERTCEIGLRKAVGATNRSILFQFLLEGVSLSMTSGFVGMALAAGVMAALGTVRGPEGFDPPKLVPMTAALAVCSMTVAGVAAGLYPARRAAMLQPVEALRQE
ncbi:MAG: ABC transporter permease [Candidatus Sulfotelmatobacter sp.]|jgi:putative ABC transport system permease protein